MRCLARTLKILRLLTISANGKYLPRNRRVKQQFIFRKRVSDSRVCSIRPAKMRGRNENENARSLFKFKFKDQKFGASVMISEVRLGRLISEEFVASSRSLGLGVAHRDLRKIEDFLSLSLQHVNKLVWL